jgi:hypothetical protein
MLYKLTILGTVLVSLAAAAEPQIPDWVNHDSPSAQGYIIHLNTKTSKSNFRDFSYHGYFQLAYDLEENCIRGAYSNYEQEDWASQSFKEVSYCNGIYKEYSSETNECSI